jgi:S-adenosylhomocysteine hydrolase
MPALRQVVERARDRQPLRDRVLLLIQHQMEDGLAQVQALLDLGARPADVHWIDIPYTSRPAVRAELVRMGAREENLWVHRFPALGSYEAYQLPRVRRWIDERWEGACGGRPLVVLDDGGYFLRALGPAPVDRRASVVEQTLRGIEVVRRCPEALGCLARVPLINVGESRPKKQLEPPAIARSVLAGLEGDFGELGVDPWSDPWLVVGWGSIGSAVGRALQARKPPAEIAVWDLDPGKVGAAGELGHRVPAAGDVDRFGVVIGATGEQTLDERVLRSLGDGALLASVSSASVEFCRDALLSQTDRFRLERRERIGDLHSHLLFRRDAERSFVLLNGGFPVNFDRGIVDRIAPEDIQFTAALMVHAAVQAAEARSPGLHDVDREVSDALIAFAANVPGAGASGPS